MHKFLSIEHVNIASKFMQISIPRGCYIILNGTEYFFKCCFTKKTVIKSHPFDKLMLKRKIFNEEELKFSKKKKNGGNKRV